MKNEPEQISDFDYFTLIKQKYGKDRLRKEILLKNKREEDFVNLLDLGIGAEINKNKAKYNN